VRRAEHLGMPLHGDQEPGAVALDRLDDAVRRSAGHPQPGRQAADGLMVQGVNADLGAEQPVQQRSWLQPDRVSGPVPGFQHQVPGAGRIGGRQVLGERAAQRDVDQLDAAADRQHRQVLLPREPDELDLDLVEVAPMANPPVCRIMDFGKFKFDEAQRAKESRRKTVHVGIKEMKYRPKIGPGDFDTKTRQVAKFLGEGHKVKITIMFRGREVYHPEHGKRILDRIAEQMEGIAKVEAEPKLDNRNMIMVLAPDKRARQAAQSREKAQQRTDKPGANASPEAAADPAAVERAVIETIAETGAASPKDIGRVMKAVMAKLSGQNVDGKTVNELVRKKLAS